jgi:hypothetical protein
MEKNKKNLKILDTDTDKNSAVSDSLPMSFWYNQKYMKNSEDPSFTLTVVVSKVDTIVHAGNADLILELLKKYDGNVQMSVLRPEFESGRVRLEMSSDDIWAKEIRNGEKILFDFYGTVPTQEFCRELSIRVNKYTQMDKIGP